VPLITLAPSKKVVVVAMVVVSMVAVTMFG